MQLRTYLTCTSCRGSSHLPKFNCKFPHVPSLQRPSKTVGVSFNSNQSMKINKTLQDIHLVFIFACLFTSNYTGHLENMKMWQFRHFKDQNKKNNNKNHLFICVHSKLPLHSEKHCFLVVNSIAPCHIT